MAYSFQSGALLLRQILTSSGAQHTMRLQRHLGDATPPTLLPSGWGALLALSFRKEGGGSEDLVATSEMVPTLVVKAEHTSRILHKAAIFGYLVKAPV
jgi:hypothetical protein